MRYLRTLCLMAIVAGGLTLIGEAQKKPATPIQPITPGTQVQGRQPQIAVAQNKAAARRALEEIYSQGRFGEVNQIYAPNCIVHFGNRTMGLSQAVAEARGWKSAAPDSFMKVEEVTESGDKVTAIWSFRGTHTGQGLGVKPTGRQVSVRDRSEFLFQNGKIVEVWNNEYRTEVFRQLGVSRTQAYMFFATDKVLAALDPIIPDRLYAFLFE